MGRQTRLKVLFTDTNVVFSCLFDFCLIHNTGTEAFIIKRTVFFLGFGARAGFATCFFFIQDFCIVALDYSFYALCTAVT